jgi:vacuolar-type H+-ATPase subunit F/Vma7
MADDIKNAERSSIEIKAMLRKLHPDRGNHNDRIRRFNKFRSFVMPDSKGKTPEFFDDDIPILFLGSNAPAAFLDEDDDTIAGLYGLLQACGTPSGDHDGTLKRSARHAMNLLKWLLLDWKELGQKKADLNIFAISFLSLPTQYYHHMQLDLHCSADRNDRGGSLEDACHIIVLILTRHLSEDGEHAQPVTLDELMSNPRGQQEFEIWSARNTPASIQELVKKNTTARQSELTVQQRQETMANKAMGVSEESEEDLEEEDETETENHAVEGNDDAMMAFRKHKKTVRKDLKEAAGHGDITATTGGPAERWEDSQLAREQRARAAQAARAGIHETVRDSQEAAQEAADREEEKARALSKDPLGIVDTDDFDIRHIERSQAEIMEQALHDLLLEVQQAEATGVEELITRVVSQKESLEAMVELMGGIEGMENTPNLTHSVVPTSHKFDPVLFLTLVHRTTSYDELTGSLQRLTSKYKRLNRLRFFLWHSFLTNCVFRQD